MPIYGVHGRGCTLLVKCFYRSSPTGTGCYFFPDWAAGGSAAAWLYIVGSVGFLYVDVLEFITFTEDPWLRFNISISATGWVDSPLIVRPTSKDTNLKNPPPYGRFLMRAHTWSQPRLHPGL